MKMWEVVVLLLCTTFNIIKLLKRTFPISSFIAGTFEADWRKIIFVC